MGFFRGCIEILESGIGNASRKGILVKGSNYLEFSVKDPADMIDYSVDKTYVIQTTNMSVVVFDKKNKTAKFGSTDDIIPYEYNPTDYSKIHLTLNVGVPVLCVIYK